MRMKYVTFEAKSFFRDSGSPIKREAPRTDQVSPAREALRVRIETGVEESGRPAAAVEAPQVLEELLDGPSSPKRGPG